MSTDLVPEYTPGEWVAVVTGDRLALLPPGTPGGTVLRLWASMRAADGASLVDHLQVLAAGDLASMPPFALLTVTGGRLHAVVRGAVEVAVTVAGRSRVLTAPHVSTWSEEVVDGAERVEVRAAGQVDRGEALPVAAGVVRVAAVRLVVTAAAEAAMPAAVETAMPAAVETAMPAAVETAMPAAAGVPEAVVPDALVPDALVPDALVPARAVSTALRPAFPRSVAARHDARTLQAAVPSPATAPGASPAPATSPAPEASPGTAPVDITLLRPAQTSDVPVADLRPAGVLSTDHDGTTVLGHEVVALRRQLPEWTGHAVVGSAVAPAAPAPARLSLSTGDVVSLSRPVLLGRAPLASRVLSGQVPRLVTVPSPLQDISRTHAEVRMDGDDVVLTDLRSTNGVLVVPAGGAPQRLQPGEATVLQPGVLVDLGEGVTFTVEREA